MLEFDTVAGDPYLFSPISSGDVMRAMTSSQWSQYAKGIVKKYTVRLVGWYRAMRDSRAGHRGTSQDHARFIHYVHEGPHRLPQDLGRRCARHEAQGRDAKQRSLR
mmetsp:Transcript_57713/g.114599  ORF Transcript_57713/g.114599 Transcript_57713/m.114599 type:complete len:106 (-) Transcript_57713:1727-2044(-)